MAPRSSSLWAKNLGFSYAGFLLTAVSVRKGAVRRSALTRASCSAARADSERLAVSSQQLADSVFPPSRSCEVSSERQPRMRTLISARICDTYTISARDGSGFMRQNMGISVKHRLGSGSKHEGSLGQRLVCTRSFTALIRICLFFIYF